MPLSRRDVCRLAGGALLLSAPPAGAAPETPAGRPNAVLRLTLAGAMARNGRAARERTDLELDLEWRGGVWQPEAWGFAIGFNTADHHGPARVAETRDRLTVEADLTLGEDPWVPGGAARYTLHLSRRGDRWEGDYSGAFEGKPITGRVVGVWRDPYPLPPPPGFAPTAAEEHPRVVFRRADRDRLLARADSPWGRSVIARLRAALTKPFAYVGDYGSDSAFFAAGHALLYYLTGDADALAKAREITATSLKTVPMRKGHQYAYSLHLMGLSVAYDLCHGGWDAAFRREVVRYLEDTCALVIAGKGLAFNHSPGSNWIARTRGGAGMALAAIEGDAGTDPIRIARMKRICERSAARYLVVGTGDTGFGVEGDGYHRESMEMLLGMMQAYRTAYGREMARGTGAEWIVPHYLLRSFADADGHPRIHRWGRHGGATGEVPANVLGLGLGSVRPAHRPAVRWFYDRFWGTPLGDGSWGVEWPLIAAYVLAHYPDDAAPRSPVVVLPRAVHDVRKGFVLFRSAEFITQLYAKTEPEGWNFPDAGAFRLRGLGTDWAVRAGVGTREMENVALVRCEDVSGGGRGRVTHYEATPDGSGMVRLDLDGVYRRGREQADVGIRSARTLRVNYSGACGAPGLLLLTDTLSGPGEWEWLLHTGATSARADGDAAFVLEGTDGATLRATFVAPTPPLRLEIGLAGENGIRTIRARPADPSAKSTTFRVVMTVQRGPAPPVSVKGRGRDAAITVGGVTLS